MKPSKLVASTPLVVSVLLCSSLLSFGRGSSQEPGQRKQVIERAVPANGAGSYCTTVQHEDGVTSNTAVLLSDVLQVAQSGERIKCLSYMILFKDAGGALLGTSFGQRNCLESSSEGIIVPTASIQPFLKSDELSATQHLYIVHLTPAANKTWGEAERSDVVQKVERIK